MSCLACGPVQIRQWLPSGISRSPIWFPRGGVDGDGSHGPAVPYNKPVDPSNVGGLIAAADPASHAPGGSASAKGSGVARGSNSSYRFDSSDGRAPCREDPVCEEDLLSDASVHYRSSSLRTETRSREHMSLLQPVKRARQRSLWLQEALAREPEAETVEPLSGGHRPDVCVVGGGYTGLWTALQIKWLDPSVGVMLLEADICGGSQRAQWRICYELVAEARLADRQIRRRRRDAACPGVAAAVAAIGRVCADYGIGADFRPSGVLITATAPAHIGAWNDAVRATRDRGIDVFTELAPAEVARRAGSPMHLGGIWDRSGARIQPALLARGLRRIAIEQGVHIWEQTPVLGGSARPSASSCGPRSAPSWLRRLFSLPTPGFALCPRSGGLSSP